MIKIICGKYLSDDVVAKLPSIDLVVYPGEYAFSVEKTLECFHKNNNIYIVALDDESNEPVGYINFSPLRRDIYDKIRSGEFIDNIITSETVENYVKGNQYNIYFASIAVLPKYHRKGIGKQLLETLIEFKSQIEKENGIIIKSILADVLSDAGAKMVEKLGLKQISISKSGSRLYEWIRK